MSSELWYGWVVGAPAVLDGDEVDAELPLNIVNRSADAPAELEELGWLAGAGLLPAFMLGVSSENMLMGE